MKNGLFKLSTLLFAIVTISQFSGCAGFTLFGEEAEESADYDRGYAASEEDDEVGECRGRYCDREEEVMARQPSSDEDAYDNRRIRRAIETRDVVLGMTRKQVAESWGAPQSRELAGRSEAGHERWTYGSQYSLGGSRVVIFEDGKVAGWRR